MSVDLNDPEVKAAIKAAVDDAIAPLTAKRDELLAELKKARKNSEISPEEYQKVLDQVDDLQGKLTEATKASKLATTEAEKYKKLYEGESAHTAKTMIESSLRKELQEAGVTDTDFLDTILVKFSSSAKVEANGDERIVTVGGKPVKDSVAEWKATPAAAKFITAQSNSGGGSGGGGPGQAKTMARADFEASSPSQRSAFINSGGVISD